MDTPTKARHGETKNLDSPKNGNKRITMNCKITEQQTRQIMRLDGDVTPNHCNTFPPLQSNHQPTQMTTSYPQHNGKSVVSQPHIPCNTTRNQLQPMNKNAQF